jgi:hypothetical protein
MVVVRDHYSTALGQLHAGKIIEGEAYIAKVRAIAGVMLRAPTSADLDRKKFDAIRHSWFAGRPVPWQPPKPEPPGPLVPDNLSPDERAIRVKQRPELVTAARERAARACLAARNASNHQQMDGQLRLFGEQARGTDLPGQFDVWRHAEAWFWDHAQ